MLREAAKHRPRKKFVSFFRVLRQACMTVRYINQMERNRLQAVWKAHKY